MWRRLTVCVLTIFLVGTGSLLAAQKTAPGSFLRYRAGSAAELAQQVRTDKNVAAKYSAHYGMGGEQLAKYFETQLRLTTLKKARTMDVYFYTSSGKVVKKRRLFPAGTMVFVNKSGQPILDWRCGNPFSVKLPVAEEVKSSRDIVQAPVTPEPVTQVLGAPPVPILPAVTGATVITEPVVAVVPTPVIEAAPLVAAAPVAALPTASNPIRWLIPIMGLAAARATTDSAPPVPEPGTFVSMAAMTGMCGTAFLARRSRKKALGVKTLVTNQMSWSPIRMRLQEVLT